MSAKHRLTEEEWEELLGDPPPRPRPTAKSPKVVAVDGLVVREADVVVPSRDPNSQGAERIVQVRPPGWVTVNFAEYERQWWEREREKEENRRRRKTDPLGLWGPYDDDE